MNAWKPPVSSWRSRSRLMWSTCSSGVSKCPNRRVALVRMPWPCASRWTSSQTSAGTLRSAMILRTRGLKTSAPPPGIVSWPAARRRRDGLGVIDLREPRDEVDLDRGERGERHVRQRRLELGEELLVVREVVLLRHPAHDVQLGDAELRQLGGALDQLVHAVGVGALVLLGPDREGAEAAPDDADVGRVEVRVDVVGDLVAVAPAHHRVRGGSELLERRVPVEQDGLVGRDAPAVGGAREDGVDHLAQRYQGLPSA